MPATSIFSRALELGVPVALTAAPEPAAAPCKPEVGGDEPPRAGADMPPDEPAVAARRRLGPFQLLKRPAEFVRGFLQAPLHHRLNLQDVELAQLAALARRQEQALQAQEHALREQAQAVREQALIQQALHDQVNALEAQAARAEHTAGAMMASLTELLQRAAVTEAHTSLVAQIIGPRFDELEVKVRPLTPYGPDAFAVRLGDGYVIAPADDPVVLTMLADVPSGGFEPGVRRVLKALLAPGMRVADVGANLGLHTLACARVVGPTGRVYALEPEERPRLCLAATVRQNGLAWVDILPVAAGRASGPQTFHVSPILGHSSLYPLPEAERAAARPVEISVKRLDELVPDGRLDVVKIDVEGAELDVLAGMPDLLAANRDIALVVEFGPSHLARVGVSPPDWFDAFAAHGLQPFEIGEPDGVCRRIGSRERKRLERTESANLVFVRGGGAAATRLPR